MGGEAFVSVAGLLNPNPLTLFARGLLGSQRCERPGKSEEAEAAAAASPVVQRECYFGVCDFGVGFWGLSARRHVERPLSVAGCSGLMSV